ncbi:MAG: hypothetical protein K8L91_07675 [Anaerolineae bacterium]|nr:hypothetical protein [Anaerolineae bacterium]
MPIFEPNKAVRTRKPAVQVDNELKPGTYIFELIVLSADGTKSQPVRRVVTVVEGGGGGGGSGGATPRPSKPTKTSRAGTSGTKAGSKKKSTTGGQSRKTSTAKQRKAPDSRKAED